MKRAYISNELVQWAQEYDLRQRMHPIRVTLQPQAGARQPDVPLNLPTEYPFLWCGLSWASNREWEDHYTSIERLETEQVTFITRRIKLGGFGVTHAGGPVLDWGPAKLINADRFKVTLVRDMAVNPAEAFPGSDVDSIIDIVLHGYDLLPKGADAATET